MPDEASPHFSRRNFLATTVATGAVMGLAACSQTIEQSVFEKGGGAVSAGPEKQRVVLKINGKEHEAELEPRVTLLDALREHLNMPGTKKGCDHGQCGACTVLINGVRVNSCLTLAIMHQGNEITTIEGLAEGDGSGKLHSVQEAFIEQDAFQCGYCTPGQICSARLQRHRQRPRHQPQNRAQPGDRRRHDGPRHGTDGSHRIR